VVREHGGVVDGVSLPSGTVTFLFTDVEASTRLWAVDSDAMSASLRVHDGVLRSEIESRGGYVFTTAGDAFCVAFDRASDAVEAAVAVQSRLQALSWPGPELRVRMGLHLGEAEERGGDYFGPVVNTAARVEQAGHGGQILLTELVAVSAGVAARDLGMQQLRDVGAPVRVFQIGESDFPPLRAPGPNVARLPGQANRLIGRQSSVATVNGLLAQYRLVTVSGAGGVGKTRLAVEVAGGLTDEFVDGVAFVDLASVADVGAVPVGFADALSLAVVGGERLVDQVVGQIGDKSTLLVVDNCEHVLDEVADTVSELLERCPQLSVLATSREVLDLDGEHVFRVPSLDTDNNDGSAVRLFVERASAADTGFEVADATRSTILSICRRLEGIPLAIELAAARARSLPVEVIAERLDARFDLLAGSRRGRLRRQQTLRATIDWSVDLLEDDERSFLRHLGVFVGGWTLPAVAAVAGRDDVAAMDLLDSLVAKSLIERVEDSTGHRYRMLETLREWATEESDRLGELAALRERHARWYVDRSMHWSDVFKTDMTLLDEWRPELANAVAATDTLLRIGDIGAAAELLVRQNSVMHDAGRGDWYTDRLIECLNSDLPAELGSAVLFLARISLETQMRLAEQRDLPDTFRHQSPGEKYNGHALNQWLTEYHRIWGDPFGADARIDELISSYPDLTGEFEGLRATAYMFCARFDDCLDAAARASLDAGVVSLFVNAAAVAAHLSGGHRADEALALSNQVETRDGVNTMAIEAYRILVDPTIQDREHRVAQSAYVNGNVPATESDYLAVFGRLAYEREDHKRARELFSAARIRQPATFSLKRWTTCQLDGAPYSSVNSLEEHRHALAAATTADNPAPDADTADGAQSQLNEKQEFKTEVERWL